MFDWFKRKLLPASTPQASSPAQPASVGFTVTVTGPSGRGVEVNISEAEIAERVKAHAFVLETDPPTLKTTDQWWEEETHKRRTRDGSDKAYAWLLPFIALDIAKLEPVQKASQWGPHSALAIAKELRALVREKRKAKQPHQDLLKALYGACVLADLSKSLEFEGMPSRSMARYVDITEVQAVNIDYATMGYQCIEAIGKADAKWLVEAFGEPAEHQSFEAVYPHVRRNAIGRYCWSQVRRGKGTSERLGSSQQAMQEWLNHLAKRNIGYHKEWQERVANSNAQRAELAAGLEVAWAATRGQFVVADLETTGLNSATDEILEFAAVLVEPRGEVLAEFSTLVRATQPVPAAITKLTGIVQAEVDSKGRPLASAMADFLTFAGVHPVFFHNAPFDVGFLKQASAQTKKKFSNTVHDTLPMARMVWPALGSYKLSVLAEHVGAPAPTHRGLNDVKATLAVLLAARQTASK